MTSVEILLVEDEPADVQLAKEGLKLSRVANRLSVVSSGEAALEFLNRRGPYKEAVRPHLILLDLNLPGMSGLDVLKILKKDCDLLRIPVVVMTTSEDDRDVLAVYENHANSFLTKPVSFDEFVGALQAATEYWFYLCKVPGHS